MNSRICPDQFSTNACPFSSPYPCAKPGRGPECQVDLCHDVARAGEAIRLVQLGARAGLVIQTTGLNRFAAHRLYRQMHGNPSPSGQAPFTDSWYRKDERRILQANTVWWLYRQLDNTERSKARLYIDVFEAYRWITRDPLLDFTHAMFVPQLITQRLWAEQTCQACDHDYIAPLEKGIILCPGCRLFYRFRCPGCGSPLRQSRKGRRRTLCARCDMDRNRLRRRRDASPRRPRNHPFFVSELSRMREAVDKDSSIAGTRTETATASN